VLLEQIMTILGLSELQLALAVIGLLILIAVAILNLKYARARRKAREGRNFSLDEHFVREPNFGGDSTSDSPSRIEPGFSESLMPTIAPAQKHAIDPRIDCVITLRFDEPISGAEIFDEINAWPALGGQSTAKWMCEGLNADVDAAEDWEELREEASYAELQLAIQLASRLGPIGVLELSDFCSRAQALAETLGSQIDMPSVNAMLEAAKELDAMAAESDIQLSINVLFDEKLSWPALQALMLQRGFRVAPNGRRLDFFSNDQLLFNSADIDPETPVSQLTFLLEVPLVDHELRPFERMLGEGVEISQSAHGRLVDDNGINLTGAAVISIRQHLDFLYANLEKSGVAAGSSTASRLFS
jgi:ZipA, C-terminal FtsZ-binding domain